MRDAGNALRNPTVLVCCLIAVALCWYMSSGASDSFPNARMYAVGASAVWPTTMAGCVITLFVMAEEREHGSYATMRRMGVPLWCIVASKVIVGVLASATSSAVALLPCVPDLVTLVCAALLVAVGSLSYVMLCVACGLMSTKQMHTNGWSVPLALASLVVILVPLEGAVSPVAALMPTQFLMFFEVALATGTSGAGGWQVAALNGVAWLLISGALLSWRVRVTQRTAQAR